MNPERKDDDMPDANLQEVPASAAGPVANGLVRYARLIRNAERARAERIADACVAFDTAETDTQLDTAAGDLTTQTLIADDEYQRRVDRARRHLAESIE